jgi:hypothetical protein
MKLIVLAILILTVCPRKWTVNYSIMISRDPVVGFMLPSAEKKTKSKIIEATLEFRQDHLVFITNNKKLHISPISICSINQIQIYDKRLYPEDPRIEVVVETQNVSLTSSKVFIHKLFFDTRPTAGFSDLEFLDELFKLKTTVQNLKKNEQFRDTINNNLIKFSSFLGYQISNDNEAQVKQSIIYIGINAFSFFFSKKKIFLDKDLKVHVENVNHMLPYPFTSSKDGNYLQRQYYHYSLHYQDLASFKFISKANKQEAIQGITFVGECTISIEYITSGKVNAPMLFDTSPDFIFNCNGKIEEYLKAMIKHLPDSSKEKFFINGVKQNPETKEIDSKKAKHDDSKFQNKLTTITEEGDETLSKSIRSDSTKETSSEDDEILNGPNVLGDINGKDNITGKLSTDEVDKIPSGNNHTSLIKVGKRRNY